MGDGHPSESTFRLRPYEDAIGGVRWSGDRLRLRPSTAAAALAVYGIFVVAAVLVVALFDARGWSYVVAVLALATGLITVRYLWCRVDASAGEITVVNKWVRRVVRVEDVRVVALHDFEPDFGFIPFSGPTTLWPRELRAGTLILRSGEHVRCDALVGLPRGERDTLPTPVEQKVEILGRWVAVASPTKGVS